MAAGALARAARPQGQRGAAAWRCALAELLPGLGPQREQQQAAALPAAAAALQQQHTCGWSSLAAATGGGLASSSWPGAQLEQRRGFALAFVNYRRRQKDQGPQRDLPERNEEIKAPEASAALRCSDAACLGSCVLGLAGNSSPPPVVHCGHRLAPSRCGWPQVRVLFPDPDKLSEVMLTKRAIRCAPGWLLAGGQRWPLHPFAPRGPALGGLVSAAPLAR